LLETLEDAYKSALRKASVEAFEGRYEIDEITQMVDKEIILENALHLILSQE